MRQVRDYLDEIQDGCDNGEARARPRSLEYLDHRDRFGNHYGKKEKQPQFRDAILRSRFKTDWRWKFQDCQNKNQDDGGRNSALGSLELQTIGGVLSRHGSRLSRTSS